jgi:hypothetical protein
VKEVRYPEFFDQVRPIAMRDPLAGFLGAAKEGVIEYRYLDAVKLAGHSCPTVAGAYLMTLKALTRLYRGELPERGAIRVELRDDVAAGVSGVIANVIALITGAAQENGFKGIGGRFDRRNLLAFNAPIEGEIRFSRIDTGAGVETRYRADRAPPAPEMRELLQRIQTDTATEQDRQRFGALWQDRVRRILIDHIDDPELIVLSGDHA